MAQFLKLSRQTWGEAWILLPSAAGSWSSSRREFPGIKESAVCNTSLVISLVEVIRESVKKKYLIVLKGLFLLCSYNFYNLMVIEAFLILKIYFTTLKESHTNTKQCKQGWQHPLVAKHYKLWMRIRASRFKKHLLKYWKITYLMLDKYRNKNPVKMRNDCFKHNYAP